MHFDGLHIPHLLRIVLLSSWVLCLVSSTVRVELMLPLLIAHAITCWNLLAQNDKKKLVHFDGLHIPYLLRSVLLSSWVLCLMSSTVRVELILPLLIARAITCWNSLALLIANAITCYMAKIIGNVEFVFKWLTRKRNHWL